MYIVSLLRELKLGYDSLVLRINTSQVDITQFSVVCLSSICFRDAHKMIWEGWLNADKQQEVYRVF